MRRLIILMFLAAFATACKKDQFLYDSSARLTTSADTVNFDTVFTRSGSITQSFKVFNLNDQKLMISSIRLVGGANSAYKININGQAGFEQQQLELAGGDSLYVFVQVTIDPTNEKNPFVVQDSIEINCNGSSSRVQLKAYGQNAHYLENRKIESDETWINDLPYIITGELLVTESATLTIEPGARIYSHANAAIRVNGTLKAIGAPADSNKVVFTSDRLDYPYNKLTGAWQGIIFDTMSTGNALNWVVIRNAVTALSLAKNNAIDYQLTLKNSIIENSKEQAIFSDGSSFNAENCLLATNAQSVTIHNGGNYRMVHCTVTGLSDQQIQHKLPILYISDAFPEAGQLTAYPLNMELKNCIFWGDEGFPGNQVITERKGSADFSVAIINCLLQSDGTDQNQHLQDCLLYSDPLFANIDPSVGPLDFHLTEGSPAINTGIETDVLTDLDNRSRTLPDLGCFEFVP